MLLPKSEILTKTYNHWSVHIPILPPINFPQNLIILPLSQFSAFFFCHKQTFHYMIFYILWNKCRMTKSLEFLEMYFHFNADTLLLQTASFNKFHLISHLFFQETISNIKDIIMLSYNCIYTLLRKDCPCTVFLS